MLGNQRLTRDDQDAIKVFLDASEDEVKFYEADQYKKFLEDLVEDLPLHGIFIINEQLCKKIDAFIKAGEERFTSFQQMKKKWSEFFEAYVSIVFLPNLSNQPKPEKLIELRRIKETREKLKAVPLKDKKKVPAGPLIDDQTIRALKKKYEEKKIVVRDLKQTIPPVHLVTDQKLYIATRLKIIKALDDSSQIALAFVNFELPECKKYIVEAINQYDAIYEYYSIQKFLMVDYPKAIEYLDKIVQLLITYFQFGSGVPPTRLVDTVLKKMECQYLLLRDAKETAVSEAIFKNEVFLKQIKCDDLLSPLFLFALVNIQRSTTQNTQTVLEDLQDIVECELDLVYDKDQIIKANKALDRVFMLKVFRFFIEYTQTHGGLNENVFAFAQLFKSFYEKIPTHNKDLKIDDCDQILKQQFKELEGAMLTLENDIASLKTLSLVVRAREISRLTQSIEKVDQQTQVISNWAGESYTSFFEEKSQAFQAMRNDLKSAQIALDQEKEQLSKEKELQQQEKTKQKRQAKNLRRLEKKSDKIEEKFKGMVDRAQEFNEEVKKQLADLPDIKQTLKPNKLKLISQAEEALKEWEGLKESLQKQTKTFDEHYDKMIEEFNTEFKKIQDDSSQKEKFKNAWEAVIKENQGTMEDYRAKVKKKLAKINFSIERLKKHQEGLESEKKEREDENEIAQKFFALFFKDIPAGDVAQFLELEEFIHGLSKECDFDDIFLKGGMVLRFALLMGLWNQWLALGKTPQSIDVKKEEGHWLGARGKDYDFGAEIKDFSKIQKIDGYCIKNGFTPKAINNSKFAGDIKSSFYFRFAGYDKALVRGLPADFIVMYEANYPPNYSHYITRGTARIWRGKKACPNGIDPETIIPLKPGFYMAMIDNIPFKASCNYLIKYHCIILNAPHTTHTNFIGFAAKYILKASDIIQFSSKKKKLQFKWYAEDEKMSVPEKERALIDFLKKEPGKGLDLAELENHYMIDVMKLMQSEDDLSDLIYRWTADLITRQIKLTAPIINLFVRGFFRAIIEVYHEEEKLSAAVKNNIANQALKKVQQYSERVDECTKEKVCARFDAEIVDGIKAHKIAKKLKSPLTERGFYSKTIRVNQAPARSKKLETAVQLT